MLMEDSALTLVPKLVPLVSELPSAEVVLRQVVDSSRPKEALLALSEAVGTIEDYLATASMSESEDLEQEFDSDDLTRQMRTVIQSYARGKATSRESADPSHPKAQHSKVYAYSA